MDTLSDIIFLAALFIACLAVMAFTWEGKKMREYRIEMIGDKITFVITIEANTEYDAKQEARRQHPHFTVGGIVEIMKPVEIV